MHKLNQNQSEYAEKYAAKNMQKMKVQYAKNMQKIYKKYAKNMQFM